MKHYCIEITPTARESLLEIGEYIALDNPIRAMSFVDEITNSLQKTLSIFPYSGKIVEHLDIEQEIRIWPYSNYNNYYRILEDKKRVEVLFIFHSSRDIQSLITAL